MQESRFFFQAEDGIRDVERSRGLGDVYKRQNTNRARAFLPLSNFEFHCFSFSKISTADLRMAVSYTHLTLPTICSV